VAKLFHWLVAGVIAAQFIVAWTMPGVKFGGRESTLIDLHFGFGALLALLVLARLVWRLTRPAPAPEAGAGYWLRKAAAGAHWLLYGLMLASPMVGWLAANARGYGVSLFGLFDLPRLLEADRPLGRTLGDLHEVTSNVLLWVIGAHVLAALAHHFLLRDRTLVRMLPG
jgi:cytochrome b561